MPAIGDDVSTDRGHGPLLRYPYLFSAKFSFMA